MDVSRALLHANLKERVLINLPLEWFKYLELQGENPLPGEAWLLNKALYGLRASPAAWDEHFNLVLTEKLAEFGFQRLKSDSSFWCTKGGIIVVGKYVDDLLVTGPKIEVEKFYSALSQHLMVKRNPDLTIGSKQTLLGRDIQRVAKGFVISNNQFLIESLLETVGLEKCKPSPLPGSSTNPKILEEEPITDSNDVKSYRRAVGKLLYLAGVRADLMFCVKELSRGMSGPTKEDWVRLRRCCRYVAGTRNWKEHMYPDPLVDSLASTVVATYYDSDWAKDKVGRKSTTGSAVFVYNTPVLTLSRTQGCIALSSAEAEVYGLSTTAIEAIGVDKFLTGLGEQVVTEVYGDSSASLAFCKRLGPGRLKHIHLRHLWLQEITRNKQVIVRKVDSKDNPADLMTKCLPNKESHDKHCWRLGLWNVSDDT